MNEKALVNWPPIIFLVALSVTLILSFLSHKYRKLSVFKYIELVLLVLFTILFFKNFEGKLFSLITIWIPIVTQLIVSFFLLPKGDEEKKLKKSLLSILGEIYSGIFVGTITDNEDIKTLQQSPIEFQNKYREMIEECVNENPDKKIVIVIDNLDRISAEKAISLLTSLKPFFIQSDCDGLDPKIIKNVWYIVPFDPAGFLKNNGDNDVQCATVNKLFDIEYNLGQTLDIKWRAFLEKKLQESNVLNDSEDKELDIFKSGEAIRTVKEYCAFSKRGNKVTSKLPRQRSEEKSKEKDQEDIDKETQTIQNDFLDVYIGINPTPREIKHYVNNLISIKLQRDLIKTESVDKETSNNGNSEYVDFFYCCLCAAFQAFSIDINSIKHPSFFSEKLGKYDFFDEKQFKDSIAAVYFVESLGETRMQRYEILIKDSIGNAEGDVVENVKLIPETYRASVVRRVLSKLKTTEYSIQRQNILYGIRALKKIETVLESYEYDTLLSQLANQFFQQKFDEIPLPLLEADTSEKYIEGLAVLYKSLQYKEKTLSFIGRLLTEQATKPDESGNKVNVSTYSLIMNVCEIIPEAVDNIEPVVHSISDKRSILNEIAENEKMTKSKKTFLSKAIGTTSEVEIELRKDILSNETLKTYEGIRISGKFTSRGIDQLETELLKLNTNSISSIEQLQVYANLTLILLGISKDREASRNKLQKLFDICLGASSKYWNNIVNDKITYDLLLAVSIVFNGNHTPQLQTSTNGFSTIKSKAVTYANENLEFVSILLNKYDLLDEIKNIDYKITEFKNLYHECITSALKEESKELSWIINRFTYICEKTGLSSEELCDLIAEKIENDPKILDNSQFNDIDVSFWKDSLVAISDKNRLKMVQKLTTSISNLSKEALSKVLSHDDFIKMVNNNRVVLPSNITVELVFENLLSHKEWTSEEIYELINIQKKGREAFEQNLWVLLLNKLTDTYRSKAAYKEGIVEINNTLRPFRKWFEYSCPNEDELKSFLKNIIVLDSFINAESGEKAEIEFLKENFCPGLEEKEETDLGTEEEEVGEKV